MVTSSARSMSPDGQEASIVPIAQANGGRSMGLQDILGKLGGQAGQQGGLDNIQSLFGGNGLQGIITQVTNAGMGQHAQSWVGTGENQKVSGQQIQQAMDPAALQQMSRQTGMSTDQ